MISSLTLYAGETLVHSESHVSAESNADFSMSKRAVVTETIVLQAVKEVNYLVYYTRMNFVIYACKR
jgi:hypothetical protein